MLKDFYKNAKNLIKKPYYYVPACPNCNSKMTGRFVRFHRRGENDWMINESLRNGEIVSPCAETLNENAFCLACNYRWYTDIPLKLLSVDEINKEKIKRHTIDMLNDRYEEQENLKKTSKKGLFSSVRNFIGPI